MHSSIKKPNLKKFDDKKKFSKKNNFVFEANSTDYQPISILKKLVNKNFKFLKVGPELTFNYSRSLFFMQKIEDKVLFKDRSNLKENILVTMKNNKKYWIGYYSRRKKELFLNSKLDRLYITNTKRKID